MFLFVVTTRTAFTIFSLTSTSYLKGDSEVLAEVIAMVSAMAAKYFIMDNILILNNNYININALSFKLSF
jgi:hypothetical protein